MEQTEPFFWEKEVHTEGAARQSGGALCVTPDEFLAGTARYEDGGWKNVAEMLRGMNEKQLGLARSFLSWLSEQEM